MAGRSGSPSNLNQQTADDSYNNLFDANGNRTARQSASPFLSYAYDDENRLAQIISTNSWKTDFHYDARGRLRKRVEYAWAGSSWYPGVDTRYIYDGMLAVQTRNSANTPSVTYTRGPDLSGTLQGAGGIGGLLARSGAHQSGGTWTNNLYCHTDATGNITHLIQTNQTAGATYKYDPFGRTLSSSGTHATANLIRFSGKEIPANSGLACANNSFSG